jgi:hypothetical protein
VIASICDDINALNPLDTFICFDLRRTMALNQIKTNPYRTNSGNPNRTSTKKFLPELFRILWKIHEFIVEVLAYPRTELMEKSVPLNQSRTDLNIITRTADLNIINEDEILR